MKNIFITIIITILILAIYSCEDITYGSIGGDVYYSGTTIPVSGVSVSVDDQTYTTGTDGHFLVNDVPIGTNKLTATKDGYDTYQISIEVEEAGSNQTIEMTSALYTHNIYGTVRDEALQPIADVIITVLNEDGSPSQLATTSDAIGYYQIPTVPQGQRSISFKKDDYLAMTKNLFMSNSDYQYSMILYPIQSTLIDIDGNTYQTIWIGSQCWMAENLRVTHYQNGDPMNTEWLNNTEGCYAPYNDDSNLINPYGLLYNWNAIDDSRDLAPEGWHVPTNEDWQILIDYLGGTDVAGGKLKGIGATYWDSPNTDATNESGFEGLPGGYKNPNGVTYHYMGQYGNFISATEISGENVWIMKLYYQYSSATLVDHHFKSGGYSIRCVMN